MAGTPLSLIGSALSVLLICSYVNCRHLLEGGQGSGVMHGAGRSLFQTQASTSDLEQFKAALVVADAEQVALLAPKVDVNSAMFGDRSPLHAAVSFGYVHVVRVLLDNGADPNARIGGELYPLHRAAYLGDALSTAALLGKGAHVKTPGPSGLQALHYASLGFTGAKYSKEDVAGGFGGKDALLKEVSGDKFVPPRESLLAQFSNHRFPNHLAVVSLLLESGADVNALTKSRESPLHFVAVYDRYQTAIMLINAGADIEITDDQKETPLHEATAYDALGVVQVLLRSGANSYAKEQHGLDPREFICRCRTYHSDSSLNQCAPGKCLNANDNLAMESFIYQARGN